MRKFDGQIYAPTIDPSDRDTLNGFLKTTAQGVERVETGANMVHIFDIAKVSDSDWWIFGARDRGAGGSIGEAVAFRSKDGGQTWQLAYNDVSVPEGAGYGFERYYWGAAVGGKVIMRAEGTSPGTPTRIYDVVTDTWSSDDRRFCSSNTKIQASFKGKLVCHPYGWGDVLNIYDGQQLTSIPMPQANTSLADLTVGDDGKLYALATNGDIYSLSDLTSTWHLIGAARQTDGADISSPSTIAVYQDYIYIGSDEGKIWRSQVAIADTPALIPEIQSVNPTILPLDDRKRSVTISGRDFEPGTTAKIAGKTMEVTAVSPTSMTIMVDTSQIARPITNPDTNYQTRDLAIELTSPNNQRAVTTSLLKGRFATVNGTQPEAATPESCFEFNAATNTITLYYLNHNNNPAQPACPTDVVIPANIGGTAVTTIDGFARLYDARANTQPAQLTSVVIPEGVQKIYGEAFYHNLITVVKLPYTLREVGPGAFSDNLLKSVTLPGSVEIVANRAFENNLLTEVNISSGVKNICNGAFQFNSIQKVDIPAGVNMNCSSQGYSYPKLMVHDYAFRQSIFGFQSSQPKNLQYVMSAVPMMDNVVPGYFYDELLRPEIDKTISAKYWHVIVNQPSVKTSLVPLQRSERALCIPTVEGLDFTDPDNVDTSKVSCVEFGSEVINPTYLTFNYVNQAGTTIAPSQVLAGPNGRSFAARSFKMSQFGANLTEAANAIGGANFYESLMASYYQPGQTASFTLPDIAGYTTPQPSQRSLVLVAGQNTQTITYQSPSAVEQVVNNAANTITNATKSAASKLANTGANAWIILTIGVLAVTGAVILLLRRRR